MELRLAVQSPTSLGWVSLAVVMASAPAIAMAADPVAVPAPELKAGDAWVFDRSVERGTSGFSDQRLEIRIEHLGPDTMVVGIKPEGAPTDFQDHIMGTDWSLRRLVDGRQTTTGKPLAFPMSIGKTWTSDYVDPTRYGLQTSASHHVTYKVTGWEDVTTPAGTFHALKIESDDKIRAEFMAAAGAVGGALATRDGSTVIAHTDRSGPKTVYGEAFSTDDYVPSIKYWVKSVQENYNSESVRTRRETDVLVSFKPAS